MNKLNKKIYKIDKVKKKNKKLEKLHNTNKDLKYWDWMFIEDEDDSIFWTAVLNITDYRFYEYDISNIMRVPLKQGGKSRGKK